MPRSPVSEQLVAVSSSASHAELLSTGATTTEYYYYCPPAAILPLLPAPGGPQLQLSPSSSLKLMPSLEDTKAPFNTYFLQVISYTHDAVDTLVFLRDKEGYVE